ncbi:MAG: hypothetical protein AAGA30_16525 [Planctomycetota bacterium]
MIQGTQTLPGGLNVNGQFLVDGDGAAVNEEEQLTFKGQTGSEFIRFDLN